MGEADNPLQKLTSDQKPTSKTLINNLDVIHRVKEDPFVGLRFNSQSQIELSVGVKRQRPSDDFDVGGEEDHQYRLYCVMAVLGCAR